MVQFNLLPDVKFDYIKARRTKHMVLLSATLVGAASLGILIMLFLVVNGLQKKHLSDVNKDISKYTKDLKNIPDLTKILTVQNQLKSLPALQSQKPVTSRLIGFLAQIIPAQVNIASIEVNFIDHTIEFIGDADTLDRVNTFADTLKFTTYNTTTDASSPGKNAFSSVVLANFSPRTTDKATYTISANFDPAIFDSSKDVSALTVPANKITTRSQTNQPSAALFTTTTKAP